MPKVTLPNIASGYISSEAVNSAFRDIEEAIDNTVSRDGSLPNDMAADLDMGSHRILNLPSAETNGEPVTLGQLRDTATGYVVQSEEIQTASAAQTAFVLADIVYQPGALNLGVFVDGLRKFVGIDYAETSTSSVTFNTPMVGGETVVFVTNQFYGSLEAPAIPSVPWGNITGIPVYASRFPTYAEVTGKPTEFTPAAHEHSTDDITSGAGLADARRGVYVQPTTPVANRTGALWLY